MPEGIHDVLLNDENRTQFIEMLRKNLDSLKHQEIELQKQQDHIAQKTNEYTIALINIEKVDRFIKNDGIASVKVFCEIFSKEMEEANKERISEQQKEEGYDSQEHPYHSDS